MAVQTDLNKKRNEKLFCLSEEIYLILKNLKIFVHIYIYFNYSHNKAQKKSRL